MDQFRTRLLWVVVFVVGIAATPRVIHAAVTLVEFKGTYANNRVTIEWETASEFSTAGFYVLRSLTENGTYDRLPTGSPQFIPATGGTLGAIYSFDDNEISDGSQYFYKLEEIETTGGATIYENDIISVLAGTLTHTPTPSETPTQTNTPTNTLTPSHSPTPGPSLTPSRTPKKTSTPSRTPTKTRTPFSNPSFSATPTATSTGSPTHTPTMTATTSATAEGLPTVAYTLAAPTETLTFQPITQPTATHTPISAPESEALFTRLINSGSLVLVGVSVLIIAGWAVIAIGGYLLIFQRKK